jgi:acetyltransferase-like isoleucine patch superfamily enzyme
MSKRAKLVNLAILVLALGLVTVQLQGIAGFDVLGTNWDGVHFDLGEQGRILIGDYCYFTNVVLLCELEVRIGSYVVIGWNTTISDTDFHPLAPAERIADAIACSPLGRGRLCPNWRWRSPMMCGLVPMAAGSPIGLPTGPYTSLTIMAMA